MKGTSSSNPQFGILLLVTFLIVAVYSQTSPYKESEDIEAQDEENDAKLLEDVVLSIKKWQEHMKLKERSHKSHRHRRDEEVVCYGDLGCFRDEGPFNYLDMLPSPPEEVGTKIFLYTRKNQEAPQLLRYNNISSVIESNFNVTCPVKFIIHGFGSSCSKVWPREMRLSFLAVEDCNVICVDWANGAVDPNYVRAAVNTRLVGKLIAYFIKMINNDLVYINERTHLIGFSLGAHVAGFAGSELTNLSRITGLDPAGPLFEGYDGRVRLDKTDANYVDVIHSNGDSLIIGGLGAWEPIGHVDFYPNGGRAQRGCQNLLIGGLYDFIYSYSNNNNNETYRYLCNHRRAYKLFTNSISPKCQFTAFPCDSYEVFETGSCFTCNSQIGECGQLGYYSNQYPGRGSLYLLTREEEPFCARQFKINLYFTSTRVPIQTYGRVQLMLIDENGLNETHTLTQDIDDLLSSTGHLEKLIVVHPAIVPVKAQILYIAYDGWIYSGRHQWSMNKLVLTDSSGNLKSFCKENGQILPSEIPVQLKMREGDCFAGSLVVPTSIGYLNGEQFPKDPQNIYYPLSSHTISQSSSKPHHSTDIIIPPEQQHKHKFPVYPKKSYVRTPVKEVYHINNGASLTEEGENVGGQSSSIEIKPFKGKHQYSSNAPSWKHPTSHRNPSPPPIHIYSLNSSQKLPPPPSTTLSSNPQ
ncbi:pancreatic triacylglycerol lipase [Lepeophtheirus salmonis]|uniref:pancreatic triacylglycerol lipase n=1 Tax=Lepeophtheirus salmonis TaxID=72036 RepID=UPI001AE647BD|nr:inactive pancreatic lipase-related protein 1-like [Lepeophtheirus salmonis]